MTRNASHSTEDIITVFARQGIAISTMARAMALPFDRVQCMCVRAHESGELQMMPPATPDDPRHVLVAELTNVRAQLDDAQAVIREFTSQKNRFVDMFFGVANMTSSEAKVVGTLARSGRASRSSIYHVLYGGFDVEETPDPKIIDIFVCRVRKKLAPHGITIETVWGTGYVMSAASRDRLRTLTEATSLVTIDTPRKMAQPQPMVAA